MKTQRIRYMLGGDMNAGAFQRLFGQIDLGAVTLTVEGLIRKVSGGGASRAPLERALLRAGCGKYDPDAVITQQSVWVEGEKIIEDGFIIGPSDLAAMAGRLAPASARSV